jgi:hypothetical protein
MALCLLYSRLCPFKALCPLFSPLSPPPRYSVLSMALCPICGPLPSLALSSLYGGLFNLYGPLSSLRPSILSMTLCFLNSPLSSLQPHPICGLLFPLRPFFLFRPSVLSTALCLLYSSFPLYDLLSTLGPSVLSTALCLLYSPLSPLWPSMPSMAHCRLYGPLSPLRPFVQSEKQRNKQKYPLVSRNVLQNAFCQNSKGHCDLFRISDNRDNRGYHDYHLSEILSDNREIAIIALAEKVAIIAIITSNKKR